EKHSPTPKIFPLKNIRHNNINITISPTMEGRVFRHFAYFQLRLFQYLHDAAIPFPCSTSKPQYPLPTGSAIFRPFGSGQSVLGSCPCQVWAAPALLPEASAYPPVRRRGCSL